MLKEVFSSISQQMQIDFERITSQISHNGEKGTARENVLQKYLTEYIPDKYSFSKGIIIDNTDSQSKQVDIIIHDKYTTPCLMDMDSTKIIPIESVYAVIEVKSILTKEELRKSLKNIDSVKQLRKKTITDIFFPTAGLIFAYDSDSTMDTVYKNTIELSKDFEPNNGVSCLCVLNKGVIIPIYKQGLNKVALLPDSQTIYAPIVNGEDSLLLFYLILIQLLTQIQVFPPDMVAYAQSGKMLDTAFSIPKQYLPDDATVKILNTYATVSGLNELNENSSKIFSGDLKKNEILKAIFDVYIPLLKMAHGSLENVPDSSTLNYFGQIVSNKELVRFYKVYQKNDKVTEIERKELDKFEDFIYKYYDMNREQIKQNRRDDMP